MPGWLPKMCSLEHVSIHVNRLYIFTFAISPSPNCSNAAEAESYSLINNYYNNRPEFTQFKLPAASPSSSVATTWHQNAKVTQST